VPRAQPLRCGRRPHVGRGGGPQFAEHGGIGDGVLVVGVVVECSDDRVGGIPFGIQSFKLAGYALWPFGRVVVQRPGRDAGLSTLGNVLWFFLGGFWLAMGHLLVGLLLCLTIIGIPLGIARSRWPA
jgi:uncharacterized membrane protein YccF (DUF307 family)